MDKLTKKELTEQMNGFIVSCAIGNECNEAELIQLTNEYGNAHDYSVYKMSDGILRSFDTDAEKATALRLEDKVNVIIRRLEDKNRQQRILFRELGPHGSIFKTRKHKHTVRHDSSPTRASPTRASPTRASPKASPKSSPKACSRRSYCNMMGGKRRTQRTQTKRRRN